MLQRHGLACWIGVASHEVTDRQERASTCGDKTPASTKSSKQKQTDASKGHLPFCSRDSRGSAHQGSTCLARGMDARSVIPQGWLDQRPLFPKLHYQGSMDSSSGEDARISPLPSGTVTNLCPLSMELLALYDWAWATKRVKGTAMDLNITQRPLDSAPRVS